MRRLLVLLGLVTVGGMLLPLSASAQHSGMQQGMTHEEHMAQLQKEAETKRRGAESMGFDQNKTTHHFILTSDGGIIAISANDGNDATGRDQIRMHLKAIADEFGRGEFGKPTATHAEVPPGVETMRRLKDRIRYTFEERLAGGAVRMATSDSSALDAIYAFLRYQITEHKTGDPLSVQHEPARDN